MWNKVKFGIFRTICGSNFIPWKRAIFFYMSFFSRKEKATPEKIKKFITLINRLVDELLSNDIAFRRQHPCTFHFSSFVHSVVLYRFFSLFLSKFVCWLTYIGTLIPCLFVGGKYFKSMFCWHIIRQQWVKVNRSKPLRDFLDFSLDTCSTSNIRTSRCHIC